MPLKYEVENLDAVEEAHRPHYTQTEGGGYRLQLNNYETTEQLHEAKRIARDGRNVAIEKLIRLEKLAAEAAQRQAEQEREDAQAAEREAARNAPFEQENTRKLTAHEAGLQAQVESLRAERERVTEDHAALAIAVALVRPGYAPALLVDRIRARLQGRHDENGKFSDAIRAEVAAHLRGDSAFAPIIRGESPWENAAHQKLVDARIPAKRPPLSRAKFEAIPPAQRSAIALGGAEIFDKGS